MTNYKRELPGDVLQDLLRQYKIESIAEFSRQHERRVAKAMGEQLARERRLDKISQDEEERMFDQLALSYNQWNNRFKIIWNPEEDPKTAWRATLTLQDIDVLILAEWLPEGSEMHTRLNYAVKLQNALYIDLFDYSDLEDIFHFDEKVDLGKAYNALCFSLTEFFRKHPETKNWHFTTMATFVSGLSKNALRALAELGVIDLPEDWIDGLPGLEQTRGFLAEEGQQDGALLARIADWVMLMLGDRLEGIRS